VTNGQLLAEIDTPELDQQIAQAKADLDQANANLALAKITADRWVGTAQDRQRERTGNRRKNRRTTR
jgi:multidrug resistance efflux pump